MQLEEIFKEDLKNYNDILNNFNNLVAEDGGTAYQLARLSLINADRWNEICLNSSKISKGNGFTKSDISQYCYHKYRILMTIHEFCRVVYRQCVESERTRWNEN